MSSSVGVPLWAAGIFFLLVALGAVVLQRARKRRTERREREGGVSLADGWVWADAETSARTEHRYVAVAMRPGGAIIEIWGSDDRSGPPPPRNARPLPVRDPAKPVAAAIALGVGVREAETLVERVVRFAGR